MARSRTDNETKQEVDANRDDPDDRVEVATPYEEVTPREAYGNTGWNEPVAEAPEALEGAIRRADDPQNGAPDREGGGASWVKTVVDEDHPLGSDIHRFGSATPGNLKDQGPLTDETGADIREYTGEPVETEEGWVLLQQQNVGPGNEAGSGEWPDPDVPSANPRD